MKRNFLFSSVLAYCTIPMFASGAVVINEINYDPYGTDNATNAEWVELYNTDATSVDLTGWTMTAGTFEPFSFPDSSSIAGHGFALIKYGETHTIQSYYKDGVDPSIFFDFTITGAAGSKLSNGNATVIALKDATNTTVQSVNYKNSGSVDWPDNTGTRNAKSSGLTFELTDPTSDSSVGTNWAICKSPSGTPGRWNSAAGVWYTNALRNITNPTPSDDVIISIDTDSTNPVSTVEAFLAVGSGSSTYNPVTLSQTGSTYSANLGKFADNTVLSYYFKITGSNGETVFYPFLAPQITEQFIVASALPAASDIVINEIGLNPQGADNSAGSEFLELRNQSLNPIDISGYIVGRFLTDPYWNIVPRGTILQPRGEAGSYFVYAGRKELMPSLNPAVTVADFGWTVGVSILTNSNTGGAFYARANDMNWNDDWTNLTLTPVSTLSYLIAATGGTGQNGWPNTTDGFTWELTDPTADPTVGSNWSQSLAIGGTPGEDNSTASVSDWSV